MIAAYGPHRAGAACSAVSFGLEGSLGVLALVAAGTITFPFRSCKRKVMVLTFLFEQKKERLCMGSYLTRFWQPDGHGMNKVERTGGAYHPYSPDTIADFEMLLSPSCSDAVARAQEALRRLDAGGTLVDTEPLARLFASCGGGFVL